jgi:hypothetical protein
MPINSGGESGRWKGGQMPENPDLEWSKYRDREKFLEWKQGPGSKWFNGADEHESRDKERERELYSIHSLCVNGEC